MSPQLQSALLIEGAPCAMSLEWSAEQDGAALWAQLADLAGDNLLIGIGRPLLDKRAVSIAGCESFRALVHGALTMPATQYDLWTQLYGDTPGKVFEAAEQVQIRLGKAAKLEQATSLFAYRQGRDLTGYRDGTANPKGDEAWEAALIGAGAWAKGSFALVQRYRHFHEKFHQLPETERDLVIGRTLQQDAEIDDAPSTAHIKRTEQEDYDPPAFMLRRSMPWGDPMRHGLQFIAFMNDLGKSDRMLARMMGLEDGVEDALLRYTQAETGAYYFIPPVNGGGLQLP